MKALILSCNCGEGHNSAGKALAEQFAHRGIPFALQDTLSFDSERTSILSATFIPNARFMRRACLLWATSLPNASGIRKNLQFATGQMPPMPISSITTFAKTGLIPL